MPLSCNPIKIHVTYLPMLSACKPHKTHPQIDSNGDNNDDYDKCIFTSLQVLFKTSVDWPPKRKKLILKFLLFSTFNVYLPKLENLLVKIAKCICICPHWKMCLFQLQAVFVWIARSYIHTFVPRMVRSLQPSAYTGFKSKFDAFGLDLKVTYSVGNTHPHVVSPRTSF